jgi:hypothetical protein
MSCPKWPPNRSTLRFNLALNPSSRLSIPLLDSLQYNRKPQFPTDASDALFSRSIQLLPLLNNPLNIELLTRHILQSPVIWPADATTQRYTRTLAGFRAALEWKVADLKEGKGGISVDEWILAVGRGAIGDGSP